MLLVDYSSKVRLRAEKNPEQVERLNASIIYRKHCATAESIRFFTGTSEISVDINKNKMFISGTAAKYLICLGVLGCLSHCRSVTPSEDVNEVDSDLYDGTLAQFRNYIRQAKRLDGIIDPNIIIQRNINDPVPITDFNVSSSGMFTNIRGRFTDVQLHGLKGFEVKKIEVNLSKMKVFAEMFVPTLSVVGDYVLDGSVTFMQVSGQGAFWMNLTRIAIRGDSRFYMTVDGLEMGEISLQSDVDDINLHFENLMGGGAWSKISNSLLNQLSELILDELKHSLLKELGSFLRIQFNDHLFRSLPPGFLDPSSETVVEGILKRVAQVMVDRHLDPLAMPALKRNFERKMLFYTARGELTLTNGSLHGLSSLARKGDVKVVFSNHSIMFVADFGFDNLTASYDWDAKVLGIGPRGKLQVQVKSVEGFVSLRQELRENSVLDIDGFLVKDIRQVWMDIDGLGTWDYIMEIIMNLATNGLKMQLADSVTGPVKENIQREIDNLNIYLSR